MRTISVTTILLATLLTSCKAPVATTAPRQWDSPPPVKVDVALGKALSYLEDHKQNFEHGYDLAARRGADHWYFNFRALPLSPDAELNVTVYDSGSVEAFPLSPPRETTVSAPNQPLHSTPR